MKNIIKKTWVAAALSFSLFSTACMATPARVAHQNTALATGDKGVVSSADPRVSAIGQEILRKGGSATDAAMAMMLALTVVEPQSSGIGGGGFLLHHDSETNRLQTIDGREMAPASAHESLFLDETGKPLGFINALQGGHSVGVPGNIRLMEKAHQNWGVLPWADLFQPAIALAAQGYEVNDVLAARLQRLADLWGRFPDARDLYWKDGVPKKAGDRVQNPALAEHLTLIANQGANAFYTGLAGQTIVDTVSTSAVNPVTLTMDDLARYQAKERAPVCGRYRAYKICGMGPPSSGATTVLQILGALQGFDMAAMGKDDPRSWHLIAEAMQLAYADREKYLADADFVNVPVNALLDPAYLLTRGAMISVDRSLGDYPAGSPLRAEPRTMAISSEVEGTTHFVAVDRKGNIANMTSTVEGPFGSQLIANGYFLNNELTDFTFAPMRDGAPVANRVEPGKRPLSSMSPTIVYDANDKVVLAIGSAGGKRIIMHVTKTLIGVLDFGLTLDDAIALPNIYFGGGAVLVEQDTFLADMQDELAALGQPVTVTALPSKLNGVQRLESGWLGAADPSSPGIALAE
jgi:gamma-glutamyltranspeptidase/glutathione hydrolase